MEEEVNEKRCKVCGEVKPRCEFNKCSRVKDGLMARCRTCRAGVRKSAVKHYAPDDVKTCTSCKSVLPLTEFYQTKTDIAADCKDCRSHRSKEKYYEIPKDKRQLRGLRDSCRRRGITVEQFLEMNRSQGGLCAICKQECCVRDRLSIDHCHITGKVRALLCSRCNLSIGWWEECPEKLRDAADYIEEHRLAL